VVCLLTSAQIADCDHELLKTPSAEQLDSGKHLVLQADGTFVIIKENLNKEKASAVLAELSAVEESGATLDDRYLGVVTVLNCLIDNELIE